MKEISIVVLAQNVNRDLNFSYSASRFSESRPIFSGKYYTERFRKNYYFQLLIITINSVCVHGTVLHILIKPRSSVIGVPTGFTTYELIFINGR